jgi:hypothetical protein
VNLTKKGVNLKIPLIILSFEILKFSPKEIFFLKGKICVKGNLKSFQIIKLSVKSSD